MSEPVHQTLFSTPLFTFPPGLPQEVNDRLTKALLKMEKESEFVSAKSNASGWRSKSLIDEKDLCFQILDNYIRLCFKKILEQTTKGNYDNEWHRNSWAIINRTGDYNFLHSHANATWSCVYYVDSGDKPKNTINNAEKFSGGLMLADPRGSLVINSRTVENQDAMYEEMFGSNQLVLTPSTGLLVFFPAWLAHSVLPYKGTKPRIAISANYYLKR